ncbi:MAG: hypothetical protein ACJAUV_000454 [Flavobacteriales bacterium]|jgi:hypothetical protein
MKNWLLSSGLFFITLLSAAQTGQDFPVLTGELLTGESFTLPNNQEDYQAYFIGMAYSKKAELDLETWFQPTFDKFILKKGLFDGTYRVQPLFVPMFIGFNRAAEKSVSKRLAEQTPKEFLQNILVYRGTLEPYQSALKLNDKTKPYLFLISPTGKILYTSSGPFTEKKMEKIADILDTL